MNDEIIPLEDDVYEEEIEVEEETDVMNAVWGNISGKIENQTDLQQALDAKQDNLTQAQLDAVNSGITSAKVATYDGYPAQITSAVSSEADIRRQADTTLQGNIDAEERARKAADKDIQDVLDGETLARQNADTALGGRIDTEIHDRQVADNGLQSQIDAITSKSDVVDVVANYAALQAYDTSTLGNNDVVKVLDDGTHGDAMTYYRWSTTTQTWSYIGQEAPYYTKSQTDTLLLDKQDKIDATHKLSADLVDDTSTTNKFVTAEDKTAWNAKQDALTAGNNINIEDGVISTPAIAPEVVAELPATGTEGKLYLTPKNYTKGTGTGNPIEATITDEAGKMESFKLDGDTEQQAYTGKNLLGPYAGYGTDRGITATPLANGKINLNGTTTTTWFVITPNSEPLGASIAAGTYTFSTDNAPAGFKLNVRLYTTGSSSYDELTIAAGATSITGAVTAARDRYYIYGGGTVAGTEISGDFALQLESGSTVTTFERFTGGIPSPSPEYPQAVQTVTGEQSIDIVGKNLFDKNSVTAGTALLQDGSIINDANWSVSGYIPVTAGNSYTLSGMLITPTSVYNAFYDENKTFISSVARPEGNTTHTAPSGSHYMRICLYDYAAGGGQRVYETPVAMLELGSTATAYAPYSKQTLPINLGKNLFDKDNANIVRGYIAGTYFNAGTDYSVFIPCEENETYTIQKMVAQPQTANRFRINSYDKIPAGGDSSISVSNFWNAGDGSDVTTHTYTTPAGAKYLGITVMTSNTSGSTTIDDMLASIQVEKGSKATTYAPYKTPIELCKLDTYQDYIWKDGDSWKVHKEIGTVVANASSDKTWLKSGQSTATVFVAGWGNMLSDGFVHTLDDKLYAQNFTYGISTVANTARFNRNAGATEYNYLLLRFDINTFDTLDKVKTWLNNNPQTIYYQLAVPTDTTITDTDLIAQLESIRTASLENGANTISNSAPAPNLAGDMEVGYYGYNPTNRYDKWLWLDLNNNYEQIGS